MWWIVLGGYIFLVNILTFIVWGVDKWKSLRHRWRISEKTLLSLSACGGFIGAIIGMGMWHHKTIKSSFLRKFRLIVFGWIVLFGVFYYLIELKKLV